MTESALVRAVRSHMTVVCHLVIRELAAQLTSQNLRPAGAWVTINLKSEKRA